MSFSTFLVFPSIIVTGQALPFSLALTLCYFLNKDYPLSTTPVPINTSDTLKYHPPSTLPAPLWELLPVGNLGHIVLLVPSYMGQQTLAQLLVSAFNAVVMCVSISLDEMHRQTLLIRACGIY